MRLSNHLTLRLSGLFIFILLIWSVVYFFIQMDEIYNGIDEGLKNLKQDFILEANQIPGFMANMETYNPLNLIIEKISYEEAVNMKETYTTTTYYFKSEDENEEVRMLTTAFYCESDSQYYKVKFFTSTVESDDMVESMIILLSTLWCVLSLVLIFATKFIINKTNRPFYTLLKNLKQFHLNEVKMIDIPDTTISEYSDLNYSIKELLQENINAYSEQKRFIENSSHELQTPIAIALGKLEMMMNEKSLTKQQMEEINMVVNTLGRAKRLNTTLLLLSKIKNKQFAGSEQIDISTVFDNILEDFEALFSHKEITVNINREGNPVVNMNPDLTYILVNNLVKNAIAHNIKGGNINITFTDNTITIANNGMPIPENVNIFERYTTHAGNTKSSGLGLAIVKSITDQYKMDISHQYSNNVHTITLKLKRL